MEGDRAPVAERRGPRARRRHTWRTFAPESGTLHVDISGDLGECTISGSGDVSVTATAGVLAVDTCGNRPSTYVLGGAAWANADSPPSSDSFLIEGSADATIPGGLPATEHMHWLFTPRG